ncbi:MAG: LptF/LptG family permease [Phycisphaerae bacterium]|nr:LptF/LptG family permease [Phycisphaerae bacterium]
MLDRYILRSFLWATCLGFVSLLTLRIVLDLLVNMDEFAKLGLPIGELARYIARYYGYKSVVYFTELGGIIIVFGAMFTLARMNHTNELTAMLASGVSLHRVVWPIVLCSMLLSGLIVADHELLIPSVASELVRDRDEVPGSRQFSVQLMPDEYENARNVWYARQLRVADGVMQQPVVVVRDADFQHIATVRSGSNAHAVRARHGGEAGWMFTDGFVERAHGVWRHRPSTHRIDAIPTRPQLQRLLSGDGPVTVAPRLSPGQAMTITIRGEPSAAQAATLRRPEFILRIGDVEVVRFLARAATYVAPDEVAPHWRLTGGRAFVRSTFTVDDLVLRRDSRWMEFLSAAQLNKLARQKRARGDTTAQNARQLIHIRVTEPINNVIMLLVGLPFILSRERNIKASAVLCLLTVGAFYIFVHLCRYIDLPPVWSAWTPLLVFGPITAVTIDAVKT